MIKIVLYAVGSILGLVATVYGSVTVLDGRYEVKQVHVVEHKAIQTGMDTFSYAILKKEIREIRTLLRTAESLQERERLEMDLQDAIDALCMQFPDDRECRSD